MITIILLKSDNYNKVWMSTEAYKVLTLSMSTGDWHTHRTRTAEVNIDQLEDLKFHSGKGFIEYDPEFKCLVTYDGQGDVYLDGCSDPV